MNVNRLVFNYLVISSNLWTNSVILNYCWQQWRRSNSDGCSAGGLRNCRTSWILHSRQRLQESKSSGRISESARFKRFLVQRLLSMETSLPTDQTPATDWRLLVSVVYFTGTERLQEHHQTLV